MSVLHSCLDSDYKNKQVNNSNWLMFVIGFYNHKYNIPIPTIEKAFNNKFILLYIQSNQVITNSSGPAVFARYNRVSL